ncbi:hypothetical protein EDB85DRAFT_1962218 [Lactarius pseudohatsudake]|nr:hypothetical protein EDB85DRAFT_1962218 [Lactarius pseudohatsudake]
MNGLLDWLWIWVARCTRVCRDVLDIPGAGAVRPCISRINAALSVLESEVTDIDAVEFGLTAYRLVRMHEYPRCDF